jgi:hypothetical protein
MTHTIRKSNKKYTMYTYCIEILQNIKYDVIMILPYAWY